MLTLGKSAAMIHSHALKTCLHKVSATVFFQDLIGEVLDAQTEAV